MGSLERIHGVAHVAMPTTPPAVRVGRDPQKRRNPGWGGEEPEDVLELHEEDGEVPTTDVETFPSASGLDLSA